MTPVRIGGSFELDLGCLLDPPRQDIQTYFKLGPNDQLLNSGRAALREILRHLPSHKMLVPDYLCGDIILKMLRAEGVAYEVYPVGRDLKIAPEDILAKVGPESTSVLLINYFGIADVSSVLRAVRSGAPQAVIVVDNVPALYAERDEVDQADRADFSFASFRKFLCVPDGSILRSRTRELRHVPATQPDGGATYVAAAVVRDEFLKGRLDAAAEPVYLSLFAAASSAVPGEATGMSYLSGEILRRLPLEEIAAKRRSNYAFLVEQVLDCPGLELPIRVMPPHGVPLALPILLRADVRDTVRAGLAARNIFCAVHWPLADELRSDAPRQRIELADGILSLPIDQRLDHDGIQRIVEVLRGLVR
jgi:hypothetical protein